VLVMTGANSAVGLRSMPVRYLFLDEVDGYPLDVEGEGDAISLAEARTRTFARRKIFIVSTPTISGPAAIEREYEASDQRRYFVPCPHCSHRQWLRFEQLRWDKGQPETAAYICESCDTDCRAPQDLDAGARRVARDDHRRQRARRRGFTCRRCTARWAGAAGATLPPRGRARSARNRGSAAAIKTFKNTELGETWVEEGEAPDWQRLVERREDYRIGSVPPGGCCWWAVPTCRRIASRLDLGLRARQGVLAGRAPRADGRHRPRRGVEATGRVDRRNWTHASGRGDAAGALRAGHRLCHAGGLCLRAGLPMTRA
jgi:phage terminase large subunit GpA-like protein